MLFTINDFVAIANAVGGDCSKFDKKTVESLSKCKNSLLKLLALAEGHVTISQS
jgi:hypothetical protein